MIGHLFVQEAARRAHREHARSVKGEPVGPDGPPARRDDVEPVHGSAPEGGGRRTDSAGRP